MGASGDSSHPHQNLAMAMHGGVKFLLACVAVLLLTAVLTEMLR